MTSEEEVAINDHAAAASAVVCCAVIDVGCVGCGCLSDGVPAAGVRNDIVVGAAVLRVRSYQSSGHSVERATTSIVSVRQTRQTVSSNPSEYRTVQTDKHSLCWCIGDQALPLRISRV